LHASLFPNAGKKGDLREILSKELPKTCQRKVQIHDIYGVPKGIRQIYKQPFSSLTDNAGELLIRKSQVRALVGELFYGLKELQVIVDQWVSHYNTERPHGSLGYRPPAPQFMTACRLPAAR